MKDCGECTLCCSGLFEGFIYGHKMSYGTPCTFCTQGCSIYEQRPSMCRSFYCGWVQGLFEEPFMHPLESGCIVSVECKDGGQYLKVVSANKISPIVINEIEEFCSRNNTYYKIVDYSKGN